jgi:hypothetical protein
MKIGRRGIDEVHRGGRYLFLVSWPAVTFPAEAIAIIPQHPHIPNWNGT